MEGLKEKIRGKAKSISSEPAAKKGRVHFIKTDRGLYPLAVLKEAAMQAESLQIAEDTKYVTEHDLIPLPFNAAVLLTLKDNCTYFDKCVRQVAQDIVGQGYEIIPREQGKEDEDEKYKIEQLFEDPNTEDETLLDVLQKAMVDWGTVGWLTLEVARTQPDTINGVFQLPAHTIRIHRSKKKFCQLRDTRKMWFKRFGLPINISRLTGEEIKTPKYFAHELIYYRNYWPSNDYYGAPNILPAIGAVKGNIGVRDYNLSFFENYGIPAGIVTLEGEWEEGSAKALSDFIDTEIKRTENAHKTVVLELPTGAKVKWEPLVIEVKEGSFTVYFKGLRDEILCTYSMPPYRIGIAEVGALGGTTAVESTKIYNQAMVKPLQTTLARIVTNFLIVKGLGCEKYRIQFKEIEARDLNALAKRWEALMGMAAINPNYIRGQLGLKSESHGDQYYISSKYLEVGEISVERREKAQQAELEELRSRVDTIIEEAKKQKEE